MKHLPHSVVNIQHCVVFINVLLPSACMVPRENSLFSFNTSLSLLHELIADVTKTYPGWILRVYHDASVKDDIVCPNRMCL